VSAPAHPAPRLYALAVAFVAGVVAAERLHPPAAAAIAAGLTGAVGLIVAAPRHRRGLVVCAAALALGFTLAGLRTASLDRGALTMGARTGADAVLRGQVLDDPLALGAGETRMTVGVNHAEIDGRTYRVRERVLLTVRGGTPLALGDRVVVDTRLSPLLRRDAPAELRASAARHRRNGVSARAFARAGGVRRTGRANDPLSVVARAGRAAVARVASKIPPKEGGLLMGMTVGDTTKLDPGLEDAFRTTGLSHLMAVSGANVAMFLGAIAAVLRLLGVRRRATLVTLALALLSFMAITRFEPSVLRAGAMASVGLAGVWLGARREALTALGGAALGLLVQDPFLVFSLGFQLSVVATLGLLIVAPRLTAALRGGGLGAVLGVTLGAQLAVAPLLAMQFHQFSVASLPANVLAVPAVAPATVLGFAAAAAGAIHEPAGVALATAARPALAWISTVAATFSRVPNASVGLPGGAIGAVVIVVLAVLPLVALRIRRLRGAPIVLATALLVATTAWASALGPAPPSGMVLTAIDVGQGDAWLVRTPRGATMLVDAGPDEHVILAKLRTLGVRTIDLLVLSHPHADHVEGLPSVIASIPVGRVIEPGLDAEIAALPALREAARERGIPIEVVRRGARYALGEAEIDILGPREPLFTGTDSDLNNNSITMRIRYGSTCLLMSGEVQEDGQEVLLERPDQLRCPVMTVPHHGSKRMLPGFFAVGGARIAVISVGRNDFGHPSGETLAALAMARVRVLRTDLSGDVSVGLAANGATEIREEHAARPAA
jgi:competence protein ComEC